MTQLPGMRRRKFIPGSLKKVFIDNTIHEAVAGIIMGEGRKEGSKVRAAISKKGMMQG